MKKQKERKLNQRGVAGVPVKATISPDSPDRESESFRQHSLKRLMESFILSTTRSCPGTSRDTVLEELGALSCIDFGIADYLSHMGNGPEEVS
jgi:hypothetical protein